MSYMREKLEKCQRPFYSCVLSYLAYQTVSEAGARGDLALMQTSLLSPYTVSVSFVFLESVETQN